MPSLFRLFSSSCSIAFLEKAPRVRIVLVHLEVALRRDHLLFALAL